MRIEFGKAKHVISGLAVALFAAVPSVSPALAGGYDGSWSVELTTTNGSCALAYRGLINVNGGQINQSGLFMQAAGVVDGSGRVALNITKGNDRLAAGGHLKAQAGSGSWNLPSQQCAGQWRATKV